MKRWNIKNIATSNKKCNIQSETLKNLRQPRNILEKEGEEEDGELPSRAATGARTSARGSSSGAYFATTRRLRRCRPRGARPWSLLHRQGPGPGESATDTKTLLAPSRPGTLIVWMTGDDPNERSHEDAQEHRDGGEHNTCNCMEKKG